MWGCQMTFKGYINSGSENRRTVAMAHGGTVHRVKGDLFQSNNSIVHCISADCHMRKGVAAEIRQRFGGVRKLMDQQCGLGQVGVTRRPNGPQGQPRYIFHLVTKNHYWERPRVQDLEVALRSLKLLLWHMGINHVSAPWLGTGLDRLPKGTVWHLLNHIFVGSGIVFTIHEIDKV